MGGSERNVPAALSPPGWGLGLGSARAGPVSRGAGFAPPSLVASCAGRAGLRRGLGSAPDLPRPDPAGHRLASVAGRAVVCRAPSRPCRSKTGLKRRPGCRGSRFLRHVGGAGPRRGTSSQTAGCGVNWSMAAVCAVCCGGTPTRPHPTVSYAADRRRVEIRPSPITRSPTVTTVVASDGHKDPWGTVCLYPSHRRDDADETEGRGRVGVPPQQTAHTAALKRLTPHPAVCEEVPRPGPARPTRRTNREPHSPAGD